MRFQDMPYERLALASIQDKLGGYLKQIKAAASADALLSLLKKMYKFSDHMETMSSLCYARNTLDTTDEFYSAEVEYWDEMLPCVGEITQAIALAVLNSPHRAGLEKLLPPVFFGTLEVELKTFSPAIIGQLQEENRLCTEYQKLLASAQIEFDGKVLTLAQLTPYHQDKAQGVRKASMEARAAWFDSKKDELDELFDKMVKVRTSMALALNYPSFVEMGYDRMKRLSYNAEMVKTFRQNVINNVVPEAAAIKAEQMARIGVTGPKLPLYDDAFVFPDGNPTPQGSPEEIFAAAREMYHEMSEETAEFIDFMLENELFDVLTRKGKAGGGYCMSLPEFRSPFIFSNFNGTAGDIDVLTHEAGHALADYQGYDLFSPLQHATYEACEVHSMSMEFLAYPYMERFFGADTEKYKKSHYADAVTFIPYGTMVDHFQHIVYEKPEMTPAERNAAWLELEGIYRPWLDMDFPFYGEGRRWQAQAHIYERPFYYIDYCLAQTVALDILKLSQENYQEAWSRYMKYLNMGGTETFLNLLQKSGLTNPFVLKA